MMWFHFSKNLWCTPTNLIVSCRRFIFVQGYCIRVQLPVMAFTLQTASTKHCLSCSSVCEQKVWQQHWKRSRVLSILDQLFTVANSSQCASLTSHVKTTANKHRALRCSVKSVQSNKIWPITKAQWHQINSSADPHMYYKMVKKCSAKIKIFPEPKRLFLSQ